MEERPLPKIHVMPPEYRAAVPVARISRRTMLIAGIAGAFFVVVAGAAWYFTAALRTPPVAEAPVTETPAPAAPTVDTPPAEPTTPAPPSADVPVAVELPPSVPSDDTDNDGLTNAEEQVLGTVATNPDTDNDGFLDGHEAMNLYNPGGFQPERLLDAGLVRRYDDTPQKLSFFYPTPWSVASADATGTDVTVTSLTGETFTLTVIPNEKNQTLTDWYSEQNATTGPNVTTLQTKAGASGIMAADGRVAFFAHGTMIVAIRYNAPTEGPLLYPHAFEMMLISLVFSR